MRQRLHRRGDRAGEAAGERVERSRAEARGGATADPCPASARLHCTRPDLYMARLLVGLALAGGRASSGRMDAALRLPHDGQVQRQARQQVRHQRRELG